VVLLWGQAGDSIVELTHLKQPASPVGPLQIEHDHDTGTTTVHRGLNVLALLRNRGKLTTADLARVMFDKPSGKPTQNERMKAKRRLDRLVSRGHAMILETATFGGSDGSAGTVYA